MRSGIYVKKEETPFVCDELADAIVGYIEEDGSMVYSVEKSLQILTKDGMDIVEAEEYLEENVIGRYLKRKAGVWFY
jgi:hypothetical protein